jgi:alpha-tubulin suppressor-like RCC1 family protein
MKRMKRIDCRWHLPGRASVNGASSRPKSERRVQGLLTLLAPLICAGAMQVIAQEAPPLGYPDAPSIPALPAVWGDQGDYPPSAIMQISGVGFQTNEVVVLQVLHADGTPSDGADHQAWAVLADATGAISTAWHVCEDDCLGSTFLLTAAGQSSGLATSFLFTDSLVPIDTLLSGNLWSWGAGESYQIGNGGYYYAAPSPLAVTAPSAWAGKRPVSIAAGGSFYAYQYYDSCYYQCWNGSNWYCCGGGYRYYSYYYGHSLVVLSDGTAWGWGDSRYGQVGIGSSSMVGVPQPMIAPWSGSGRKAVAVAAGYQHSLILLDDGTVWGTGWGVNGELGNGSTTYSYSPVSVSAPPGWTGKQALLIAAGYYHSLAALDDGTVWAWGRNYEGQLGDGTTSQRLTPVSVLAPTAWNGRQVVALAGGAYHSTAVLDDGTVWTWGYNGNGQLGDGTTAPRSAPGQVLAPPAWLGRQVVDVAAGGFHTLAILDDGTLWAWGYNGYGELGMAPPRKDSALCR